MKAHALAGAAAPHSLAGLVCQRARQPDSEVSADAVRSTGLPQGHRRGRHGPGRAVEGRKERGSASLVKRSVRPERSTPGNPTPGNRRFRPRCGHSRSAPPTEEMRKKPPFRNGVANG